MQNLLIRVRESNQFLPKNILPRPTVRKLSYCAYFPTNPDNLRIFLQYISPAHRIPKLIHKQYTFTLHMDECIFVWVPNCMAQH